MEDVDLLISHWMDFFLGNLCLEVGCSVLQDLRSISRIIEPYKLHEMIEYLLVHRLPFTKSVVLGISQYQFLVESVEFNHLVLGQRFVDGVNLQYLDMSSSII